MSGSKATTLDAWAHRRGQAFVRFDYQGHGASSGRFEDGTIGSWADDALAVLDLLTEGPQILVGSSMGGWIALLVALARPERVAGLVTVAAAPDFTEDLIWPALPEAARAELVRTGQLTLASGGPPITRALIEDGRQRLLLRAPIPLRVPARLLHGQQDAEVPWSTSVRLAQQLDSADVQLTLIKDGDHRLSRPQDLALLVATLERLIDGL